MVEVKLTQSKSELKLSFPNLSATEIDQTENPVLSRTASLVESGVRQVIFERCALLPQFQDQKLEIVVYQGLNLDTPTAIEFTLDDAAEKATGWDKVCAKVFFFDRKEYEPRLFDILPINMD
jgi:hypothetical protein